MPKKLSKKTRAKRIVKKLSPRKKSSLKVKRARNKRLTSLTTIAFITGLLLVIVALSYKVYRARILSFDTKIESISTFHKASAVPTAIIMPDIEQALPVEQTTIDVGIWDIASGGASHLGISSVPGHKGPIVIYAHNTKDRFGSLHKLAQGDIIFVVTKDGKFYRYKTISKQEVWPSDGHVLEAQSETLILYTCTGFADSMRLVVKAERVR